MSLTLRVFDVSSNHSKTRVWKGRDGLWHVVLWGHDGTSAMFGKWERAIQYATTGRIEY